MREDTPVNVQKMIAESQRFESIDGSEHPGFLTHKSQKFV
jgi:hypothetical protein